MNGKTEEAPETVQFLDFKESCANTGIKATGLRFLQISKEEMQVTLLDREAFMTKVTMMKLACPSQQPAHTLSTELRMNTFTADSYTLSSEPNDVPLRCSISSEFTQISEL